MAYVMTAEEFINKVLLAVSKPSLYVMGGWGFPLTASNKERTQKNEYNRRAERKKKIDAAAADVFAWDCVGLTKGILWGWIADASQKNGGASYAANGVPDWDAKEMMFKGTVTQSKDFSDVKPGEFLWLDGHCGVYLGDGLAAESTPIWKDGAQITAVANIGKKAGYNSRTWTYHGPLKYVDYSAAPSKYPAVPFDAQNILKGVSIRSIPYSDGEMIGKVAEGAKVTVEEIGGSSGDFARISGWVYLPGGFTWEQEMDGYKVGETYTVICSELNLRTAATTAADVVTELSRGTRVTCKALTRDGSGNTWMRIEEPAGWACALYQGAKYIS